MPRNANVSPNDGSNDRPTANRVSSFGRRTNRFLIAALLLSVSGLIGCSGSGDESGSSKKGKQSQQGSPTEKKDQTAAAQPKGRTLTEVEQKLVGLWLGGATMEEPKVQQVLDSETDPAVREQLLATAQLFLSTQMAIQFSANGTMEQHVEVTIAGKKQEMVGTGTWQVLEHKENKMVVEVVEIEADRTATTTKRLFQFYPNGKRFVMPAPVGKALANCDAVMVFEQIPDLQDNRTAAQPNTQTMK